MLNIETCGAPIKERSGLKTGQELDRREKPSRRKPYLDNIMAPTRRGLKALKNLQITFSQSFDSENSTRSAESGDSSSHRRRRKSLEMFCRSGSKILPDFFPPDAVRNLDRTSVGRPISMPVNKAIFVRQYSWELELGNGKSDARTIAESWLVYFGFELSDL